MQTFQHILPNLNTSGPIDIGTMSNQEDQHTISVQLHPTSSNGLTPGMDTNDAQGTNQQINVPYPYAMEKTNSIVPMYIPTVYTGSGAQEDPKVYAIDPLKPSERDNALTTSRGTSSTDSNAKTSETTGLSLESITSKLKDTARSTGGKITLGLLGLLATGWVVKKVVSGKKKANNSTNKPSNKTASKTKSKQNLNGTKYL